MKILVEYDNKRNNYTDIDGLILALKDYSVQSTKYYSIKEIVSIKENNPDIEIFVKVNKNIFNNELNTLEKNLKELDKLNINGIFFYDLAILNLKDKLKLKTPLVWDQTHMVNNYLTCDYYYSMGVKYALLGKEITLNEILEIIDKSKITSMVEVVSMPTMAFSRRRLLTNYYKSMDKKSKKHLDITEKVTNNKYLVTETKDGTSFYDKSIMNGTSIINALYKNRCPYIILREFGIKNFDELVTDTKKYIDNECNDISYITKYKKLGDNTNFFFKKTVYQVKKNEK